MPRPQSSAPLSDAIIIAMARLVDDSQSETREPSHSDLDFQIERAELKAGDPKTRGQAVGKAKRIRATLSWALENNPAAGELLVANLISHLRGCGGFRATSPNFVGADPTRDAANAFRAEGYELSTEGELRPLILEGLSGSDLTCALEGYVRRAKRGADDAALVTGTGKDLLEATAAHILMERWGSYSSNSNFPTLLGQAFVALDLATPAESPQPGEPAQKRLERAMYELGCAINTLRNKEGTGHGRPWLPSVTDTEARAAIEFMGAIAERLLAAHKERT
ncbi:MAG TPA: abortive infection family protein [Terriglobia bacterium]|nr:abortive infection family protein [Terriglobia bacterium]